jgi:hypothetical protein
VDEQLLYGQLVKRKRSRNITRMLWGHRKALIEKLKSVSLSGLIQTAFIERANRSAELTTKPNPPPIRRPPDAQNLVASPIQTRPVNARSVVETLLPLRSRAFFAKASRARLEGTLSRPDPNHGCRFDQSGLHSRRITADAHYPAGDMNRQI